MRFMNGWEIEDARDRFASHPLMGPASRTLANLRDWTDANSDGWAYWPAPVRAAEKLIELVDGFRGREVVSVEQYRAALRPIRSFRTRHGASFEIVEAAS